jgi:pimeloyl-ACP methyl ester carboxylesterase
VIEVPACKKFVANWNGGSVAARPQLERAAIVRSSIALLLTPLVLLGLLGLLVALSGVLGWLANRLLPPRGRFVSAGGERIHLLELGSGPPLLLIHGLGGQTGNFTYALVDQLASDFRVLTFDRPGSGHSSRARGSPAGVRAQAEQVSQLITALGLQDLMVMGHSLGGAVALALALQHPEQVRALALVAPLTQALSVPPPAFRLLAIRSRFWREVVGWTVAAPLGILRSRQVLEAIFSPQLPPADFARRGGGLLTLRPWNFVHACEDMAGIESDLPAIAARYGQLQVPVSILFGRGDQILDPRRHGLRFGEQQPAAHLEFVDGGHMLPVSQPQLTADFIRRAALRR